MVRVAAAAVALSAILAGSSVAGTVTAPAMAASEGLPPFTCIEALRSARIADAAGRVDEAESRYEGAIEGCGRHLVALLELFAFLERRGLDPTTRTTVVAELERRLGDPTLVVPDSVLEQLAFKAEASPNLLAAVDQRCRVLLETGVEEVRQQPLWRARGRIAERRGDLDTAMVAARHIFELGEYNFEAQLFGTTSRASCAVGTRPCGRGERCCRRMGTRHPRSTSGTGTKSSWQDAQDTSTTRSPPCGPSLRRHPGQPTRAGS